ncbi:hypothetical protein EDC04DRAFT_2602399 [Pisolithus marmoratus]|nr:hypothetical protein EDC04DRAFT_2602399 [Pisolithus marmoratus]
MAPSDLLTSKMIVIDLPNRKYRRFTTSRVDHAVSENLAARWIEQLFLLPSFIPPLLNAGCREAGEGRDGVYASEATSERGTGEYTVPPRLQRQNEEEVSNPDSNIHFAHYTEQLYAASPTNFLRSESPNYQMTPLGSPPFAHNHGTHWLSRTRGNISERVPDVDCAVVNDAGPITEHATAQAVEEEQGSLHG